MDLRVIYFNNNEIYKELKRLATGISVLSVSKANLSNLQIPLPPLKEQEKIARILGVWDSALDTLANLIKAKRKYKTALMQRLLTPPRHTPFCHTEGVARSIQKENLQGNAVCLDSSLSVKAQNDKEKIHKNDKEISPQNDKENPRNDKLMDCHELPKASLAMTTPPRHTTSPCHTERSEVSKSKGVDFVDTSAFSKPQYDKVLDSCNASPPRHCEEALATKQSTKESLRFAGFSDKWQEFRLGDIVFATTSNLTLQDIKSNDKFPVFGANGLVGYADFYQKENEYLGVVKDGAGVGRTYFLPKKSSALNTIKPRLKSKSFRV